MSNLIDKFNRMRDSQKLVDETYEELTSLIEDEMSTEVDQRGTQPKGRQKNTPRKPYWNKELSQLWRITNDCNKKLQRAKKNRDSFAKIKRLK